MNGQVQDNGKGTGSYHIYLCHLGTYIYHITVTPISNVTTELWLLLISKGSSKDTIVMYLLHFLWFFIAHYDITITVTHLHTRMMNTTADHLSHGKLTSVCQSNPVLSP